MLLVQNSLPMFNSITHSWAVKLIAQREISYLCALMYFLFIISLAYYLHYDCSIKHAVFHFTYGQLNSIFSVGIFLSVLTQGYNKHCTDLVFLVHAISYEPGFWLRFVAVTLRAWAVNPRRKTWSINYSTDLKLG